ncbi:TerC family protein [Chenggangzhangella methanolivorans]|uniref:TerC family protein n=1 Tax=Chenggangzhangella methanolivorans TaxID=1437009 RepID=UPI003D168ECC
MACRSLPARQRKMGMVAGAGVAIALRVLFTLIIVRLLGVPYLKILGALALLYIAVDLVGPQGAEDEQGVKSHESLWRAIATIAIADVVMSLDNVIAIAGVAGDHFGLLVLGLVISVPMIVAGSAVILAIMDKFPLIVWAGAALLGYVAGEMLVSDKALEDHFGGEYVSQLGDDGGAHARGRGSAGRLAGASDEGQKPRRRTRGMITVSISDPGPATKV